MNSEIPSPRRRRRRWLWLLVLLIVAGVGLGGAIALRVGGAQARGRNSVSAEDLDLRLGKTEVADIQVAVNEVGTIEPTVKVDVKSTLSGKVTELLVREGDRV